MPASIETVDDYLAALPPKEREVLGELRETIRSAAPEATEAISYKIPLYTQNGHLVGFGAFKHHCSLFVTNSEVPERFAKELEPYTVNHTTIQFPVDDPLPASLVERIVRWRIAENEGRRAR